MKKVLALVLTLVLVIAAAGTAMAAKVGVAMPTQSLQRWIQDGNYCKENLEAAGYEVDLQYADNDVAVQISQIENMILGGCDVLIIASIDGGALGTVLADAAKEGIVSIAYDRLLMDTPDVTYYTTFNNVGVGTIQGQYLIDTFDLDNYTGDPLTMEIFCGDAGDNNAPLFYKGAWDAISPYVEAGTIVVPSEQTAFEQCATPNWDPANAQARMDNLLTAYYADGTHPDMVLCSNDSTAQGVVNSLLSAGFTAEDFPVITGQDCDVVSVINMINGLQSMSVFKDTRTLAAGTVELVIDILTGAEPNINASYNNRVIDVPTNESTPVFGDADNYKELVIDSGYYYEGDGVSDALFELLASMGE